MNRISQAAAETDTGADLHAQVRQLEQQLAQKILEAQVNDQQLSIIYNYVLGLQDVIPGALIVMNHEGTVQRTNGNARDLLGYGESEMRGAPIQNVWKTYDPSLLPLAAQTGAKTHIVRQEVEWTASDGTAIPVLLSACGQWDEDNTLVAIVLVGVDIRDRRKLELDLRQAQKMESIGQLAAGIAHEINTPMQFIGDNLEFAISGVASLIEASRGVDSRELDFVRERLPRALQRAKEGAERVNHIVRAMKVFTHPNTQAEPTDLNEVLSNTLVITKNDYKHVAEAVFKPGDIPRVLCSRSDIGQVAVNLIVNAAHAIKARHPESGGRLTVSTFLSEDRRSVVFSVADNGCGIPVQLRHRVFDPFFTTKPVGEGTGQGLAISHGIVVDHHHGRLWFESTEGAGTTFYVSLPIEPPAGATP